MARINSKVKGNTFENRIAKELSKQLAPYNFKRVPNSGAQLGGINVIQLQKYNEEIANVFVGDLICINEDHKKFRFNIECKSYKQIDTLEHLFNNSKIYQWMNESIIDAQKTNKDAIVIFKFNRSNTYVATNVELPIRHITIFNNIHICELNELLTHKDFWFV